MKTGSKGALTLLLVLCASLVAQPALAIQQQQSHRRLHETRALLQLNVLQDLFKSGGLVSSLLGPNGLVADLLKKLNLDQVLALIPVLTQLELTLQSLAIPGGLLSQLLAPGGVVDKLLGPTGTVNGLLLALGLSQALQLTPVLIQLQNVLNTLAGSGGGGGAGAAGSGQAAIDQLQGAASQGLGPLGDLIGGGIPGVGRKLLQGTNLNTLQDILKPGGLVDALLGPTGLVGDLITKLNLNQVIQILPVLVQLQLLLRSLAITGGLLSQLLAPGGVVDKLLGPTGSVNGLLLALGLSQTLQLTPVLIQLQNVLNTVSGTGGPTAGGAAGGAAAGAGGLGNLLGGGGGGILSILGGATGAAGAAGGASKAAGGLGGLTGILGRKMLSEVPLSEAVLEIRRED